MKQMVTQQVWLNPATEKQRGFTLLELIVAIAIFSIMAVMAYSGLDQVLKTRHDTEASADKLIALQRTMLFLGRDIQQTINRPIRDEHGDSKAPMIGSGYSGSAYLLEFTRTGWRNPANLPRSNLQRVAWGLDEDVLKRAYWPTLDRAQDGEALTQEMLKGVKDVEVRFMDASNAWHQEWPVTAPSANGQPPDLSPPRAVEIELEHKEFGKIVRLFAIPGN